MSVYSRAAWAFTCLVTLLGTGCCCTQGMNSCSGVVGCSTCPTNSCGTGPLMGLASCRGGCGETYVDEWVSEPPCIDDCGYCETGCNHCGHRRPVRSMLRLLWGVPYRGDCGCSTGCDSGCGGSCGGGCSSCDGGMSVSGDVVSSGMHSAAMHSVPQKGCNCGASHSSGVHMSPVPMSSGSMGSGGMDAAPSRVTPGPTVSPAPAEAVPTPAPETPSSAKRLSPAQQRNTVTRAATR